MCGTERKKYNLNYICQISSTRIKVIGFFLKISTFSKEFYCIIPNIEFNEKELQLNESIEVYYNNKQNHFSINLKKNKRFLRYYMILIQLLLKY